MKKVLSLNKNSMNQLNKFTKGRNGCVSNKEGLNMTSAIRFSFFTKWRLLRHKARFIAITIGLCSFHQHNFYGRSSRVSCGTLKLRQLPLVQSTTILFVPPF